MSQILANMALNNSCITCKCVYATSFASYFPVEKIVSSIFHKYSVNMNEELWILLNELVNIEQGTLSSEKVRYT